MISRRLDISPDQVHINLLRVNKVFNRGESYESYLLLVILFLNELVRTHLSVSRIAIYCLYTVKMVSSIAI